MWRSPETAGTVLPDMIGRLPAVSAIAMLLVAGMTVGAWRRRVVVRPGIFANRNVFRSSRVRCGLAGEPLLTQLAPELDGIVTALLLTLLQILLMPIDRG